MKQRLLLMRGAMQPSLDGIGDTPVEALWDLQGAIEHRIMLSKNQGFNMPKPSVWDVKQQRLREP